MPIVVPLVDTPELPGRLPRAQALDTYLPFTYQPTQDDPNPRRWLAGVTFVPRGRPTITVVPAEDPCVVLNSFGQLQGFGTEVTFRPFRLENGIECSSIGGYTPEELQAWIIEETRGMMSYSLARQVWGVGGPNPDLRDQADVVTTPGDTTPIGALAAVEAGLNRRLAGRRGMVHMSTDMATRLKAAGAFTPTATGYETVTGHTVVADAGYDGSAPAGLQLGRSWIYGSGPIYFRLDVPNLEGEWWEAFNRVHNDTRAFVAQWGIVLFEPDFVVGAESVVATSNA